MRHSKDAQRIPRGFVILVLLEIALLATASSACDFDVTDGIITSPGYPSLHKSGSNCSNERYGECWHRFCVSSCTTTISTDSHKSITLSFSNFSIPLEDWCCPNHLEVWDGLNDSTGTLLVAYCGIGIPDPVTTTTNHMFLKLTTTTTTKGISFRALWTTGCATKILNATNGAVMSPRFPLPITEDGTCTWIISVTPGNVIDFQFETFAVGEQGGPPCDSVGVRDVVSLYDSDYAEDSKLIRRFCSRDAQLQNPFTTSGSDLTITFTTRNTATADWNRFPQYGFSARYSSRNSSGSSEAQKGLFLYGAQTYDKELLKDADTSDVLNSVVIPVGNERKIGVKIHKDGKITFCDPNSCDGKIYICVYCTEVDHSDDNAGIFYNVYNTCPSSNINFEQEICIKAKTEVESYTQATFIVRLILVVTWHNVKHKSATLDERVTFQAAIISDGITTSYALVYYREGSMKWTPRNSRSNPISIEIATSHLGKTEMLFSRTEEAYIIDTFKGNTGRRGTWIYLLADRRKTPDDECTDWYNANKGLKVQREQGFKQLPSCPCSSWNMQAYGDWVNVVTSMSSTKCYRLSKASSKDRRPFSKMCCYMDFWGPIINDAPDAGSAFAFNPAYPSLAASHSREDRDAHDNCCIKTSNPESCKKYYDLRPAGICEPNTPFTFSWLCCDPRIMTLDEKDYAFNGWGEYTMMTLSSSGVTFTLQGRTERAETENGLLANATVFTAFGAKENGVSAFVGLDPGDRSFLIVYINGTDYSLQFNSTPDLLVDTEDYRLVRNNHSVVISFTSGNRVSNQNNETDLKRQLIMGTS